jgi:hypothetical protein
VTGTASPGVRRVLLRFDVSAVPVSATVEHVELHLVTADDPQDGTNIECSLHQVMEPWAEFTATWDLASVGTPWSASGCGSPSCSGTASLGSFVPAQYSTPYTVTIDPAIVQGWVDGSVPNYGLLIANPGTDMTTFVSSESTDGQRPSLAITWH